MALQLTRGGLRLWGCSPTNPVDLLGFVTDFGWVRGAGLLLLLLLLQLEMASASVSLHDSLP